MFTKSIALVALLATAVVAAPMPEANAEAARWEGSNRQYWGSHGRKNWGKWRTKQATSTEASAASEPTVEANNFAAEASSDDSSSSSSSSSTTTQSTGGYTYTGIASYYDISNPAENEGYAAGSVSCSSQKYSNSDKIVAIASQEYDGGSHCGKQVEIKDNKTGNVATATVVDQCMSCDDGQLDLTPSLWTDLHGDNTNEGIFDISWKFI